MNTRPGASNPDGKKPSREFDPTAPPVPARDPGADLEATASGAVLEPTVRLDHTESFIGEPTEKSTPSKGAVLQPVARIPAPKEGEVIANRFLVRRLLGQGGMGRVYAVQDRQIEGRDVALKVLLPKYSKSAQFRKLFFQEVRAAQGFVSEYICQVRDTGETEDGSLFLTMDLIEGESLRALLDREKILGARQALEITRQVLLGLHSGHEKGFVHRDIKPPNVMLLASVPKTDENPYGVAARLLDFGIAGLASEIDERSRAGTVMYMSPEQASGERLDPRSDLFAVGVLLYEMLSGHRPFEGTSTRALVQSVLETNLTARLGEIPNLSKPVRRLLERALQKDRDKRFQSATEFAEAITRSSAYKLPKEVPAWAYAGLLIFGVAAVAQGAILYSRSEETHRLRLETAGFPGQLSSARQEVQASMNKDLQSKQEELLAKENQLTAANAAVLKSDGDYRKAAAELEVARSEISTLNQKLGAAGQAEIDDAQIRAMIDEAKAPLIRDLDELGKTQSDYRKKLDEMQSKHETLAKENADLKLRLKPEGRKAETFDRVLTAVEEERGDTALVQLSEAAKQHSIFLSEGSDGVEFLNALATSSAELRKHSQGLERDDRPDMEAVSRALAAHQTCRTAFASLPSQTKDWIAFQIGDQPPGDRIERARLALERIGERLANVRQVADQSHESAWQSLSAKGGIKDTKAVFAHADRYRCTEHLAQAAERLVDELRAQVSPDGNLDLNRLNTYTDLAEWVKRHDETRFPLERGKVGDLHLFEFAQRWYGDFDSSAKFEWNFATPEVPREATTDWRQVMYLQWQLAANNKNFPIKFGRSLLYRRTDGKQPIAWRSVKRKDETNMILQYQEYGTEGFQDGTSYVREYAIVDGALRVKGTDVSVVDFHSRGANLSVVPFPISTEEFAVPPGLASDTEVKKFRKFAGSRPLACLAVKEPSRLRLFSPEFGEVLEETPGGVRHELVSATGVQ